MTLQKVTLTKRNIWQIEKVDKCATGTWTSSEGGYKTIEKSILHLFNPDFSRFDEDTILQFYEDQFKKFLKRMNKSVSLCMRHARKHSGYNPETLLNEIKGKW